MTIEIEQLRTDVDAGIKRVSYENLARAALAELTGGKDE